MVKINLLPWREERRKQRQRDFYVMQGAAAVAGVLLSALGWMWFNGQIAGQQARNAFLEQEIQKVEQEIKEIETLQQKRESLLNRKQVIEELQVNRFRMVHLFDSLMRTVPEGLVLTNLKQDGESLTLEGRAQSNTRVATYMRNLENSGWMKDPDVSVIEVAASKSTTPAASADSAATALPYMFTMRVTLGSPEDPRDPNAAPAPDPVPVKAEVIEPLTPVSDAAGEQPNQGMEKAE